MNRVRLNTDLATCHCFSPPYLQAGIMALAIYYFWGMAIQQATTLPLNIRNSQQFLSDTLKLRCSLKQHYSHLSKLNSSSEQELLICMTSS